jgi:hypothetical protein
MAGDKSDTRVWDAIMKRVREAARTGGAHVRVGVLASQGGGGTTEDGKITMVELAAIHEYGSPAAGIPQRSFIRRALAWNSGPWLPAFVSKLAKGVLVGKMSEERALEILGARAVAEVKKTITGSEIPPPLRPATIAAKGSSRPLVDSGRLLGSISYEVKK